MKKILLLCTLLFSLMTNAQLNVNNTLYSPADLILTKLIGPGLSVFNVKYNGVGTTGPTGTTVLDVNQQLGFYTTGATATSLGLSSGLIMTNGSATGAVGPNSANGSTTPPGPYAKNGDPDLSLITTMSINNICILEFDFIPLGPEVKFEYVFGSEEYPEYVNSSFNDVFGFFLSGPGISGPFSNGAKNIALLPNNTTPISINNVNCGYAGGCPTILPGSATCSYYVNNCGGPHIQYDGFTTVLTARSEVQCGQTYHIKLAIADAGDTAFDSAVFFKENSFSVPSINLGGDMIGAGKACCGEKLPFSTPFNPTDYPGAEHNWYFNGALIYTSTTSNTFIYDSPTCTDGILKVVVKPYPTQACTFEDEIVIEFQYGPPLNAANPLTLCSDTPATATGVFDLNMQINAIVPNYNSDYEDLGFYLTEDDARANTNMIPSSTWHTFNGTHNQSIFLGVSNLILTGNVCRTVMEFKLEFVNCDYTICSPTPSSALFDLTTRKPMIFNGFDPTKYSISFHHDMPSAVAGTGAITPENAYVSMSNPEEIFVRYWENAVPLNKQFTQFTLQASQSNYAGTDGTLTFCKDDTVVFNLADYISGEQTGGTWTIVSGSGATVDLVAGTITSNNNAGNYVLQYEVNASPSCPTDISIVNVTINAVCGAQTPPNMILCDNLNNGVEIFDLSLQNAAILGTLSSADYTVSYHTSAANATSGASPITPNNAYPNISNPQTIYIRVIKNSDGSLFDDSKFFDLIVIAPPTVTSFTGTAAICNGSSTNLVFAGTPNTTVTYNDGTSNLPVTLDATGNATVSVSPTATTTYTLVNIATTGTPVCTNTATGTVTVTVNNPPVAGTDGVTTVCETSIAVIDLYSLITGEQAGGTWARTGGIGGVFNALAGTFTPAVGATSSTFEYTLLGAAPCTNDVSQASVTINPQPIAGTDGATLVCETSTTAIDLFSLITGEQAGGTWTRTTGVGGTFDAVAGTFTPAVGASANNTFTYTLTAAMPCIDDSSVATVTINPQPVAGTDGLVTVCETSPIAIDLFSLITGEQAGGVWTRTAGLGGTFNAAAGTFTPAVGVSAINTFEYTLIGTLPCINDVSVATINVNPQPNAGTDGAPVTVCETSTATIDLFSLIAGEQAGGTWSRTTGLGGTFDPVAGTFTPATGATSSTFTYTLTAATPCVDDTSLATITINPQPVAGTDGTITVCESSTTPIDLFSLITGEQTGGTWVRSTGIGGVFNATAGTYTPAAGASATSTFTYTLTGTLPCINDSSVATVNLNAQPNAGTDGNTTICDDSVTPINLFSLITGEQAGGVWTRTSGVGGTFDATTGTFTPALGATTSAFTYLLTVSAPCISDSSVATVNINAVPTATILGTTGTCAGIPVNITVNGTPGATVTWTGTPSSFVINASGSNVFAVSPATTTTYTLLTASNGCSVSITGQSATVTVSATPQFVTQIPDATICDGATLNIASQLTSTVPGTTYVWSASTNNVNLPLVSGDETNIDQVVDLINALENGTITIAVKPKVGNCFGNEQQIVITIKPIPVINSVTVVDNVLCNNEIAQIDVDADPAGTTFAWQINTATNVQIVGGATSGTSTTGNIDLQLALIDPLVTGSISFDVTPTNGICTGATATNAVSVTVNPIPGTPIGLLQDEVCSEETTNLTISAFPNITGTELEWVVLETQNVTGATPGSGLAPIQIQDVLINTSDVQGFVKYRVKTMLGDCEGGFTDYTIFVDPLPKPSLIDGHICVDATSGNTYQSYILNTQLNNPNYTYDWFVYNTATSTFDPIAGATASTYEVTEPGEYQVIVTNQLTGCYDDDSATVIEVFPATNFTYTVTDAFTNSATITVNVNPIGTGALIYSLDGGAWQTSNVFTGVEAGIHTVMVSDEEGCTNMSQEVLVVDYMKYFTPNGDGFNDTWNIVGLNAQHNAKIYIFDRYGKLIKQIDPLGNGWDGKYNGQDIPSTDYWFSVDYTENEQQKQFKAHFTLKR